MTSSTSCGDLLLGDEDMRVVLGEGAHAHQPVQRARRLEAVHLAELGDLERQIAIGFQAVLEDLDVAGAVHRLDHEGALVLLARLDEEHASRKVAMWPEATHSDESMSCGALTST